jgi:phage terminase small subunit
MPNEPTPKKNRRKPRVKKKRDELNPRQQRFVAELLANGGHSGKAALAAGYSAAEAPKHGSRLARTPKIRAAIEAGTAKSLQRLSIKADDVLAELAKVAFAEEMSPVKVRALELLGKHHQLFVERVDMRVDAMRPEERAARAAALLATAQGRLLASGATLAEDDES